MCQKILEARRRGASGDGEPALLAVDQVVITDRVEATLADAKTQGLGVGAGSAGKRTPVELAIAYDLHGARPVGEPAPFSLRDALAHGLVVARAGVGYPPPVHTERFASPARLCVTDSPRMAAVGGASMLCLSVTDADLGRALATGTVKARMPITISVVLSGRLRPFVSAVDVALELVRRGTLDVVQKARARHGVPVVLEMTGSAVRHLSISERAQIAQIAPEVSAAAALFPSDERTKVFLGDQRRSKAHRPLCADPGAGVADTITLDLGAVDPLVRDAQGVVRPARDLAGTGVDTVLVGGDGGASLRDLLTFAALLKSKRVHDRTALLVAPPSRQVLEVLARSSALSDLVSTGARLVEPDLAVLTRANYPGSQLRTCLSGAPSASSASSGTSQRSADAITFTASAETCAHAVTRGELGDPRNAKRVVRITVPRDLPTDDVLITRKVAPAPKSAKS